MSIEVDILSRHWFISEKYNSEDGPSLDKDEANIPIITLRDLE